MRKIYDIRMNQQYNLNIQYPKEFRLIIKYRTNSTLNSSVFCDITPCSP
jgi:plasmid maintenance system killer protein